MAPSFMSEIHPHGEGGKFGRKVTKDMVETDAQFRRTGTSETSWRCISTLFGRLGVSVIRSGVRDLVLVKNCPEFSDSTREISPTKVEVEEKPGADRLSKTTMSCVLFEVV